MALYKEIVTKAIVGKGKKYFKDNYFLEVENNPTTILGCWVINHKFKGYKTQDKIGVNGSFDVNIWYSYDSDSKTMVATKKVEYTNLFNVKVKQTIDLNDDTDIIVKPLKQPSCSAVNINDKKITFDIEKELGIEIVGETKVKIAVEEDEEPWDDIIDDVDDKVMEEIDNSVQEEYIEDKN